VQAPDGAAQRGQPARQHLLGGALRHAQGEPVARRHPGQPDRGDDVAAVGEPDPVHPHAGGDELPGAADLVEDLQGRRVHQRRPRLAGGASAGVHHHVRDSELGQPGRHGQPGRARSHDGHIGNLSLCTHYAHFPVR
jgi:hypothetical protein